MKSTIAATALVMSSFTLSSVAFSEELSRAGQPHAMRPASAAPQLFDAATFFADRVLNGN